MRTPVRGHQLWSLGGWVAAASALLALVLLAAGCGEQVFTPKPVLAPQPVTCFDSVGHHAGAKPWILGGTCCCTPTAQVLLDWKASGYFADKSLEDVVALYKEKGIELASETHHDCNNLCPAGPHVTKGGHCMVAPTPGTENYEEVLFGQVYLSKDQAPKSYADAAPSREAAYTVAPKPVK